MATKDDTTAKAPAKAAAAKASEPAAQKTTDDPAVEGSSEPLDDNPVVSDCVVNDGRGMHVGRAVNGKVCSYHAMHYNAAGDPR